MKISPNKTFQTLHVDNQLREFEELMLDNALLKIQNQKLMDRNPKWKEWCQIMQEIKEEQIQNNLEIAHTDEEAYMFELVAYRIQFLEYTYD